VWQTVALVTLGILLVLAVVGLFYSLAVVGLFYSLWQRRSERSRTSEPSRRQHGLHI
jgi:CHASE1-domain containing sensor protein